MRRYIKELWNGLSRPLTGWSVIGILMGLIALPSYGAANIIPDPSMETGTAWVSNTPNGAVVNGVARTGNRSIRLTHNGNGNPSQTQTNITQPRIPGVTPGAEYVFTVYIQGNNIVGNGAGGKPLSVLRWRNSANTALAKEMYMWAPYGSYSWIPSTIHLQAPSTASKVDVGFRIWWDVTGGLSYWDDTSLTLREFPNRGNLLASYQVENGTISNGAIQTNEPDYTGSGFFKPNNNGYVQWTNVSGGATGGQRIISMRYAHEGNVKNVELLVNGVSQGLVKPVATGRTSSWASHDWVVNLNPGNNTVRLRAVEYTAGPLFDKIDVYSTGSGGGTPTVGSPGFNPDGGIFQNSVNVQLSSPTPGATIYYTTNGSIPTASSTPYGGPFTLNSTTTVNAIGKLDGYNDSGVVSRTFTIDSGGGGAQSPYGGSVWQIPGRIEAENYDLGGSGVAYNDTTNGNAGAFYRSDSVDIWRRASDGAAYVGTTKTGEWLEYTVNVASAGQYIMTIPAVTAANGKQLRVLMNGTDVTGAVAIPNTGDWESWSTLTVPVTLNAGQQIMRLQVDSGSFNVDYFDIRLASAPPSGQSPYGGTPWALPGLIEAENYDLGGQGVAYNDTTTGNDGNIYRNDNVDLWATSDTTGSSYMVGSTPSGEWLEYTVNVAQAGAYTLNIRATTAANNKRLRVLMNGADVTGAIAVPNTGGWQNWQTISKTVNLNAGQQVLRLQVDTGSVNINWISVTQ